MLLSTQNHILWGATILFSIRTLSLRACCLFRQDGTKVKVRLIELKMKLKKVKAAKLKQQQDLV
jgi:hypothetical protein